LTFQGLSARSERIFLLCDCDWLGLESLIATTVLEKGFIYQCEDLLIIITIYMDAAAAKNALPFLIIAAAPSAF